MTENFCYNQNGINYILKQFGDASVAKWETQYESLTYQLENNLYDNDNDIGKKELMDEIREWNGNLAYCKEIQRNFWVGIYYPNVYDNFEFIPLP